MSAQNVRAIEVLEDKTNAQGKEVETNGEHLYEEELFKTTKKRKVNEDGNEHNLTLNTILTEEPKTFLEEEKTDLEEKVIRDPKENSKFMSSLTRSREIHRQLMNKKNRWKPSELEIAILRLHFNKNSYPSKEEKEDIILALEEKFHSKIDINQISRWFQHEREKGIKQGNKSSSKSTYKKFLKEELDYLKECFAQNTYPKTDEMVQISKKLGVSLSKIENWYKHNRRSLAKKGAFSLKTKKYFKKDEVSYLAKMFDLYPRPTKEQVTDMSNTLNCTDSQIKNWYSNKRKKQKLIAKRQGLYTETHSQISSQTPSTFKPIGLSPNKSEPCLNSFMLNPLKQASNQSLNFNNLDQKPLGSTFVPKPLIPNTQYMPAFSGCPVFIIPTSTMNNSTMAIQSNIVNTNTIIDTQMMPTKTETKKIVEERAPEKMNINNPQMSYSNYNHEKLYPKTKQHTAEMSTTNWVSQTQTYPMANPVIIIANKPQPYPTQPIFVNSNGGIQNGMSFGTPVGISNGIPIGMMNGMNTGMPNGMNTGMPNGIPISGPQMIPYEPPMQIQYLTSLYAPYSNNNIFSNYYPVVYQNGQGLPVQQNKMNQKMEMMNVQNLQQQIPVEDFKTVNRMNFTQNNIIPENSVFANKNNTEK